MQRVMSGLVWCLFLCFMSQQDPCLSHPGGKDSTRGQSSGPGSQTLPSSLDPASEYSQSEEMETQTDNSREKESMLDKYRSQLGKQETDKDEDEDEDGQRGKGKGRGRRHGGKSDREKDEDEGKSEDEKRQKDEDKDEGKSEDEKRQKDGAKDEGKSEDGQRGKGKGRGRRHGGKSDREKDEDEDEDEDEGKSEDGEREKDEDESKCEDGQRGKGKGRGRCHGGKSDREKDEDEDEDEDEGKSEDGEREKDEDESKCEDGQRGKGKGRGRCHGGKSDREKDEDEDEDEDEGKSEDGEREKDEDESKCEDGQRGKGKGRGRCHGGKSDREKDEDEDKDEIKSENGKREKDKDKRRCGPTEKPLNKKHDNISPCPRRNVSEARRYMGNINNALKKGNPNDVIEAIESLEKVLEETDVNATTTISIDNVVALLHKNEGLFKGLEIFASDYEATSSQAVANSRVSVWLPEELDLQVNDTVVFCMLNMSEGSLGESTKLYDSRLVGLSVGRAVSGLQQHINVTITLTTSIGRSESPVCHFYDFSTREFNRSGCETEWLEDQGSITCSCDHLTYFGILLLSPDLSEEDQEILTYITVIGCSLSLLILVITVLLFFANSKMRTDLSMKIHVNLAIALILLNLHFLPSQAVAALQSNGPCLYVAVALHYSLLATLVWMALEGYHLYLLFVKVFNIYVRCYLLKLGLVGWGVPAVVVSLVAIIKSDSYGRVPIDSSNANATEICYITDDTVKMVTTFGVFCFIFLFNFVMFGVSIKRVMSFHFSKEYGQSEHGRNKQAVCTLLGISILLGITWGLVFFSFGYLTTPGLYVFCILNSLQGFFIFLWFVMSLRKTRNSSTKTSSETRSTNS